MKFLLCCTLVPEKYEVKNREISNAANRFLNNLCKSFRKEHSVEILSYIGVDFNDELKNELMLLKDDNVRYFFKSKNIFTGVLRMFGATWREVDTCDYVITYNVVYAWMLTALIAKIKQKNSILILADYSPKESYTSKKRQLYAQLQKYFIEKYDYVIGLSENTKKYLKQYQNFMCMEGGIANDFYDYFAKYKEPAQEKVILMYSGILEKVTGIDLLVSAFTKLQKKNVKLVITGDGSLAEWICQNAEKTPNIEYLGCLPYRDYMKKLYEADILINPRNMSLPENANNFPSKIMEYLATGKMIISTKFPGWERYCDYISFCDCEENSLIKIISEGIVELSDWTIEMYHNNREYAQKFLWDTQVSKMIEFIQ